MTARLATLALLLVGCPKPPPTPVSPVTADLADLALRAPDLAEGQPPRDCPAGLTIAPEDTCEGLQLGAMGDVTMPCVNCPGGGGCIHREAQVYCARGGCLNDRACKSDPEFRPALRNGSKKAKKKPGGQ